MNAKTTKHAICGLMIAGATAVATGGPFSPPLAPVHAQTKPVVRFPPVVQANTSCSALLQGLVSYANSHPDEHTYVDFTLVSNRANRLASYTTGYLDVSNGVLSGSGTQSFSDRTNQIAPTGSLFGADQPFNVLNTDQLGVSINATTGATTLTLLSWGGGQVHIPTMQCADGVMYGFGGRASATALAHGE